MVADWKAQSFMGWQCHLAEITKCTEELLILKQQTWSRFCPWFLTTAHQRTRFFSVVILFRWPLTTEIRSRRTRPKTPAGREEIDECIIKMTRFLSRGIPVRWFVLLGGSVPYFFLSWQPKISEIEHPPKGRTNRPFRYNRWCKTSLGRRNRTLIFFG